MQGNNHGRDGRTQVSTGSMLLGLIALPIVLVSATAMLVDITSSSDAGRVIPGVVSVLAGAAAGVFMLRLTRCVLAGLSCLAAAATAFVVAGDGWLLPPSRSLLAYRAIPVPVRAVTRQPVLRRGPPQILR